jgi:hypothetical protein
VNAFLCQAVDEKFSFDEIVALLNNIFTE